MNIFVFNNKGPWASRWFSHLTLTNFAARGHHLSSIQGASYVRLSSLPEIRDDWHSSEQEHYDEETYLANGGNRTALGKV